MSLKGIKWWITVRHFRVIVLWSRPKNRILTVNDQFSKISFSDKWFFKILAYKIFCSTKIFFIFFNFSNKIFLKKKNSFLAKNSQFFWKFLEKIDFWKSFFRKLYNKRLIHVSWDKMDNSLKYRYLPTLTSNFIGVDFWSKTLMSTITLLYQMLL